MKFPLGSRRCQITAASPIRLLMVQKVEGCVPGGWPCRGNGALQCWGLWGHEWRGQRWSYVSGTAQACITLPELLQPPRRSVAGFF